LQSSYFIRVTLSKLTPINYFLQIKDVHENFFRVAVVQDAFEDSIAILKGYEFLTTWNLLVLKEVFKQLLLCRMNITVARLTADQKVHISLNRLIKSRI